MRSMISARSVGAVFDHGPVVKAACAASTAAFTSSSLPTGTEPQTVLVAGSVTSMFSSPWASCHSQSLNWVVTCLLAYSLLLWVGVVVVVVDIDELCEAFGN